jgi:hypothetical protein
MLAAGCSNRIVPGELKKLASDWKNLNSGCWNEAL